MNIIELLQTELEREEIPTRKMLSIIPDKKFAWRPHPRSMDIRTLATHIAELPSWITLAVTTEELDFAATPYNPTIINKTVDMVALYEKCLEDGKKHLALATIPKLQEKWLLRSGDIIHSTMTKYEVIRHAYSQTIHHRAQLGVFLRLLDVKIPGTYGPSADDQAF